MSEKRSVDKLVETLKGKENYIMWKRNMLAFLRLDDIELLALQAQLAQAEGQKADAVAQAEWRQKDVTAKSNIILTLGPQPTVALANVIDDDQKFAKDL